MASFVFLPALVICFGERRAAITMMCFGLSGFILMGFSGITASDNLHGDGSSTGTTPVEERTDAGAGRWIREACMVAGYPLHNMVCSTGAIVALLDSTLRFLPHLTQIMACFAVVQCRHDLYRNWDAGSRQESNSIHPLALAISQYVCAKYVAYARAHGRMH